MWVSRAEARQELATDIRYKFWKAVAGIGLAIAGAIGVEVAMAASMISNADTAAERLTEYLMPESAKNPSSAPPGVGSDAYQSVLMGVTRKTEQNGCLPAPDEHTIAGLSEDQALPAGILVISSLTSLIGLCARRRQRDKDNMRYDNYAELDSAVRNYVPPDIRLAVRITAHSAALYARAERAQPLMDQAAERAEQWLDETDAETKSAQLYEDAAMTHPLNAAHYRALISIGQDADPEDARLKVLSYTAMSVPSQ